MLVYIDSKYRFKFSGNSDYGNEDNLFITTAPIHRDVNYIHVYDSQEKEIQRISFRCFHRIWSYLFTFSSVNASDGAGLNPYTPLHIYAHANLPSL